ncbi:hypothetical protein GE061_019204 [Apolygus lucorum]|uniref:Uncharacterized protein n=1 Tax=Apolygus lucorum TaxID=248454 RepID=A0A8S9X7S8_APOLU|nr:hypothetical protein GE061_019204 [Apolygus lucorum]
MACSGWSDSPPRVRRQKPQSQWRRDYQRRRSKMISDNMMCGGTPMGFQSYNEMRFPMSAVKRRVRVPTSAVKRRLDLSSGWTDSGRRPKKPRPQWYTRFRQNERDNMIYDNLECGGTPTGFQAFNDVRVPRSAVKRRLDLSSFQPSYIPPQDEYCGSPMDISSGSSLGSPPGYYGSSSPQCGQCGSPMAMNMSSDSSFEYQPGYYPVDEYGNPCF